MLHVHVQFGKSLNASKNMDTLLCTGSKRVQAAHTLYVALCTQNSH